jgi:pyruvate formate lyase activating enzyme
LALLGREYTVEALVKKAEEDGNYWWRSGGGPTIGGGEPLAQSEFVGRLLKAFKGRGYHTVIDTCGYFHLNAPGVDLALRNTDLLLYDIKLMDPAKHKQFTGYSNDLILSNILAIAKAYPEIEIVARTPVIPGINDTDEEISEIAKFLLNVSTLKDYELLAYHAFGSPKYGQLGRNYCLENARPVNKQKLKALQELARKIIAHKALYTNHTN